MDAGNAIDFTYHEGRYLKAITGIELIFFINGLNLLYALGYNIGTLNA